jgi:hypothetical protein
VIDLELLHQHLQNIFDLIFQMEMGFPDSIMKVLLVLLLDRLVQPCVEVMSD